MAPSARIELICVGTELLEGQVNTHESYIGLRLRALGLSLSRASTLPDDENRLAGAIAEALSRSDAVLVAGGLGPTFDDITRESAAAALGVAMTYKPRLYAKIAKKFARYKTAIPEENKRQAFVLEAANVLNNPHGSAPGQMIQRPRPGRPPQCLALLPGPLAELSPMFERLVLPRLRRFYGAGLYGEHVCIRLAGQSESAIDEKLAALTQKPDEGLRYTILSGRGQIDFHIVATGSSRAHARRRLARARRRVYDAVGELAFGEDSATLESALGHALVARRLTIATAESCTGGLLSKRLTSVPGSSRYFIGGVIAYDNAIKAKTLGVDLATLKRHGAVSSHAAREMARSVKRLTGASLGLSITGIAGPAGGTRQKPVGLVFVALSGPGNRDRHWQLNISGQRETVRERAAAAALNLSLRAIKAI